MIRGLYSAASALDTASQNQEVTAYNLAHSSTPGYRQRGVTFETFDRALGRTESPTGDVTGTRVAATYHDFRPGSLQFTGAPLDLALEDTDRFFVLAGPRGNIYSRNGAFRLDGQSRIVSDGGYALQGEGGAVNIPPGTSRITIASDGNVSADGVQVGRIQTARFTDLKRLTAVGPTLYRAEQGAGPQIGLGKVLQGYRESSNVQPAEAMVRMIDHARYFDAAQRALRTIAESVQLNTRPQT